MASTTSSSVKAENREATLLAREQTFKENHDLEMQEMKPKASKFLKV